MKRCLVKNRITMILSLVLLMSFTTTACAEDTVTTILSAGTTQAFTEEAVLEDDLNTILQAGLNATSAINQQPWFFVALTNHEIMEEISANGGMPMGTPPEGANLPAGIQGAEKTGDAPAVPASTGTAKAGLGDSPAAIIIYMNEATSSPNASFDCGLACQNMVIAANSLGYGTKIISSAAMALNGDNHNSLCEKLGVDPALTAVAVLLIGHADTVDATSSASLRNGIKEKVSFVE